MAAVVDLNGSADWARAGGAILGRPTLALRGAGWAARVIRAGVPIYRRHAINAAHGETSLQSVTIAPVDRTGAPMGDGQVRVDADALTVGNGLIPATEIPRLLRAEHRFDRTLRRLDPSVRLGADGRASRTSTSPATAPVFSAWTRRRRAATGPPKRSSTT